MIKQINSKTNPNDQDVKQQQVYSPFGIIKNHNHIVLIYRLDLLIAIVHQHK
jgi:hypothetical protein